MDDLPERLDFAHAERHEFLVEEADAGIRLDRFLVPRLDRFSRSGIQRLIERGAVLLDGAATRPAAKLHAGDRVVVDVPQVCEARAEPEDLPLDLIAEEDSFMVINKSPGIAVHPGRGRPGGTIANALAFRYGDGAGPAHRPGIVHRLDLDTSGVMVIARGEFAHARLTECFAQRKVTKEYRAIVFGEPAYDEDDIDLPLGRDLVHPTRMAVRFDTGKPAQTRTEVLERFGKAAHVLCLPRTGRTHQIRVHLLARGHPILGDATYAGRRRPPVTVPRLMLHAHRIDFPHPETGVPVACEAPLPPDFEAVLDALRDTR